MGALERLVSAAGPALGPSSDSSGLLGLRNGFYAFDSALHVFPRGTGDEPMSVELWNTPSLWRSAYPAVPSGWEFFAEDAFGDQFVLLPDGSVGRFAAETGEVSPFARDVDGWASALLAEYEMETGWPMAQAWQALHGPLRVGQRLVPRVPFVSGGAFSVENLYAVDAVEGMRARGSLARQVAGVADGETMQFRVVR